MKQFAPILSPIFQTGSLGAAIEHAGTRRRCGASYVQKQEGLAREGGQVAGCQRAGARREQRKPSDEAGSGNAPPWLCSSELQEARFGSNKSSLILFGFGYI